MTGKRELGRVQDLPLQPFFTPHNSPAAFLGGQPGTWPGGTILLAAALLPGVPASHSDASRPVVGGVPWAAGPQHTLHPQWSRVFSSDTHGKMQPHPQALVPRVSMVEGDRGWWL